MCMVSMAPWLSFLVRAWQPGAVIEVPECAWCQWCVGSRSPCVRAVRAMFGARGCVASVAPRLQFAVFLGECLNIKGVPVRIFLVGTILVHFVWEHHRPKVQGPH